MTILYFIDLLGTMVFAISGALTAKGKQLDLFGISAVAFITALGGGTLRDLLMGITPVAWMTDLTYLIMIAIGIICAMLFGKAVLKLRKTFFLFDTIGISVFTVLGIQKALNIGISPTIAIMMGMVSAVFGGVTRDIVCNEIPLIFRKEIYALTCLFGGVVYILLDMVEIDRMINVVVTCAIIIVFRGLAAKYHWKLPSV